MKKETESLIVVVQNQSIRTNVVKATINKSQKDSLCRLCKRTVSIDHALSGCSKLAQKEYKRRHDNLGKIVHWKFAGKCKHKQEPETFFQKEDYKILWDFSIQIDHIIEAQRLDLVVVDKKRRTSGMKIIPLVVGCLGAILKQFDNRLKETDITEEIGQVQKTVLLGTVRILRKVLEI